MFIRTLDYCNKGTSKAIYRLVYEKQDNLVSVRFHDLINNTTTDLLDVPVDYAEPVYRDLLFRKVKEYSK